MRYFFTRSEADETSPMDNWHAIHFRRLCHLIEKNSSTTRSTSVLLSWSGWSLDHCTNSAAEPSQTWKSSLLFCLFFTNWSIIWCTVSRSICTACRCLESGVVQENICKYIWAVGAVSNFRRPSMNLRTLLLMVACLHGSLHCRLWQWE